MLVWLVLTGAALVVLAVLLLAWSARMRQSSGLPSGRVLLSDTGIEERGKPLYSERYGLAGTPDYIVDTPRGAVPVEVKPSRTESEPHESHLLQVLAYCLLIEETWGKRPPHGLLRYKHDTFKVDYNKQTRAYLIQMLQEMRAAERQVEVPRSHDIPARCRACAYNRICDQSLLPQ
jgi:CRISPR-associated exonuclease Cas4